MYLTVTIEECLFQQKAKAKTQRKHINSENCLFTSKLSNSGDTRQRNNEVSIDISIDQDANILIEIHLPLLLPTSNGCIGLEP